MILVINCGSSSIKAKLFEQSDFRLIEEYSFGNIKNLAGHRASASEIAKRIKEKKYNPGIIAHRIVLGGAGAVNGEEASKAVMRRLKCCAQLDPLHIPPAVAVIEAMKVLFPKSKNVLAHDIAFFATLPQSEYTYPINKKIAAALGIRRYGFHGISHQYAYEQAGKQYEKVITIHLGAGCSATAIINGEAIATSMGLTPQGGLVMQTRTGDIDPEVVLYLVKSYGYKKAKNLLENNSGLSGLTGTDGDMLKLLCLSQNPVEDESFVFEEKISETQKNDAQLAIDIFCQRVRDFIGAYSARMCGLDCIIFTGKIGYGSKYLRDRILYGLDYLSLKEVATVKPDEEMAIAKLILKNN